MLFQFRSACESRTVHAASPVTPLFTPTLSLTAAGSVTVLKSPVATSFAARISTLDPKGIAPSTHSTSTSFAAPPTSIRVVGVIRNAVGSVTTKLDAIRTSVVPPWYARPKIASLVSAISTFASTIVVASVTLLTLGVPAKFGVRFASANVPVVWPA